MEPQKADFGAGFGPIGFGATTQSAIVLRGGVSESGDDFLRNALSYQAQNEWLALAEFIVQVDCTRAHFGLYFAFRWQDLLGCDNLLTG
jgi:hypothetical protein